MHKAAFISIFSLMLLAVSAIAAEPKIRAEVSERVYAGEPAAFSVIISGDDDPEIEGLPKVDGIRWGRGFSKSTSSSMVNFRKSSSTVCTISFIVDKEGDYVIPSVKLKVGKQKTMTDPVTFHAESRKVDAGPAAASKDDSGSGKARQASLQVRLEDALYIKFNLPVRRSYYVGEDIPVVLSFYHLVGIEASPTWPEISFEGSANAVLRDYSQVNPKNPNFEGYKVGTQKIDGRSYEVVRFSSSLRALSSGKLTLKAICQTAYRLPQDRNQRRSSFDIDFPFGDPFMRPQSNRDMAAESQELEMLPLPPLPQGAPLFIGLVGDWKPEFSLSSEHARVGETLSLTLKLNGSGSTDTLKAPQFEIPGFRVYPPEVESASGKTDIRYILIPAEEGDIDIQLGASVFDTESGRYKFAEFKKHLKIAKGHALGSASFQPGQVVVAAKTDSDSIRAEQDVQRKAPTGVLYLKKNIGKGLELPLWRNAVVPCAAIIFAGLAAMGAMLFVRARRDARDADPKYARRSAAAARRKDVMRALKEASPDKLSGVASEKLMPYLSDLLDAPPGAGAAELAELLRKSDPELAGCLDSIAGSAWAPGAKSSFDESFKKRLLDSLGKLAAILLLLILPLGAAFAGAVPLAPAAAGAAVAGLPLKAGPASLDEAMTAYDSGDFQGASSFFKSKLDPARPSPALLYDLGNCLYQLGDFPKALLCYERALRLSPRDSDILENLNLVRRKLDLPQRYKIESPADALPSFRDSLRPDEWACLAALGLAMAFASLGLRRLFRQSGAWLWLLSAGLALGVLSCVCIGVQLATSYSPDDAIVVSRAAVVRSLPSDSAPASDIKLRLGEQVQALERRGDWLRIRSSASSADGWLKAPFASFLWRGGEGS